jgi:hypothetical protein
MKRNSTCFSRGDQRSDRVIRAIICFCEIVANGIILIDLILCCVQLTNRGRGPMTRRFQLDLVRGRCTLINQITREDSSRELFCYRALTPSFLMIVPKALKVPLYRALVSGTNGEIIITTKRNIYGKVRPWNLILMRSSGWSSTVVAIPAPVPAIA